MRRTINITAIIILVILVSGGGYYLKNHKNSTGVHNSGDVAVSSSSKELYIKEWGIHIKLPQAIDATTYEIASPKADSELPPAGAPTANNAPPDNLFMKSIARLYLEKYQSIANQCFNLDQSKKQPFVSLIKEDGKPSGQSHVLKTFSNFYVIDAGPSIDNFAKCSNKSVQPKLAAMNNQLDAAINNAFSSATEDSK